MTGVYVTRRNERTAKNWVLFACVRVRFGVVRNGRTNTPPLKGGGGCSFGLLRHHHTPGFRLFMLKVYQSKEATTCQNMPPA